MTSTPPPEEPQSQSGRSDDPWGPPEDTRPDRATPDPSAPGDYAQPGSGQYEQPGRTGFEQPTMSSYEQPGQAWSAPSAPSQPYWSAPPSGPPQRPWAAPPPPAEQPFDPYRFGPPDPGQFESFPPAPRSELYPRPRTSNGKAIAGLVLGILALILSFLTLFDIPLIVLGIVFSVLGLRQAKRGNGGRGMAIAGLSCAIIGAIVAATLFIVVYNRAKDCADKFDTGTSDYRICLQLGAEG